MPEEDPLVVRLASGPVTDDDLTELRVQVPRMKPTGVDVLPQRAERAGPRLAPVVDDDLVHHVGERQLDGAHGSVRDHETARLDPLRPQQRLGALET